ncbi:MAG: putative amidophosphoribosyltransferase, partial [Armatimonadetes bacterium OLB18]
MREAKPTWTRCIRRFLDTAYAPRCGLCAVLGEGGICSVCFSDFEPFPAGDEEEGRGEMSPHVRSTAIAFRYEGRASQAVQRLKYSRVTSLAEEMARLLAEAFDTSGIPQPDAFCARADSLDSVVREGVQPVRTPLRAVEMRGSAVRSSPEGPRDEVTGGTYPRGTAHQL